MMVMNKHNNEDEVFNFCLNESKSALSWTSLSLTTFSIFVTVFIIFHFPKNILGIYVELVLAFVLSSGVLFSLSWYIFSYISDPRTEEEDRIFTDNEGIKLAENLETFGCFVYGVAITLLLFSLNLYLATSIFIIVYGSFFLFGAIIQRDKIKKIKK